MRLFFKVFGKLILPATLIGLTYAGIKFGPDYLAQNAGKAEVGEADLSTEESGLVAKVFDSAGRFLSGTASREELAGELSEELYSNRADAATMSELGIEMVNPQSGDSAAQQPAAAAKPPAEQKPRLTIEDLYEDSNQSTPADEQSSTASAPGEVVDNEQLSQLWEMVKTNWLELGLAAVVVLWLLWFVRSERRKRMDDLVPAAITVMPSNNEPFDPDFDVQSLTAEEFELLVALIHQRQGYRVTMPAAQGGGSRGDFLLFRKNRKVLVKCKRHNLEHEVPVDRVKDLQEAMIEAGTSHAIFVVSCNFSWDARNFAKANDITVVNARTLDAQIADARKSADEDLLDIASWAPEFLKKVKWSDPLCPTCDAPMDQIPTNDGFAWVCSERPDCRGRRNARKYQRTSASASVGIT